MPSFPGGDKELLQYLHRNIKYPESAKSARISGTVYLRFIIERDGALSNIRIIRGTNSECDAEAVRVLKSSPTWNPGKHHGKPVRVQYTVPVKFALK